MNKRKQDSSDEPEQSKRSRMNATLPFRNKRTTQPQTHRTPQPEASGYLVDAAGAGRQRQGDGEHGGVSDDQESPHPSAAELSIQAAELKIDDDEYDDEWNGFEDDEEEVTDAWSITSDNGHSDSEPPTRPQIRAEAMRTIAGSWGSDSLAELLGDDIIPKEATKPSGLSKSKTRKADPIIKNLPVDRWSTAIKVALADLASVMDVRRANHHLSVEYGSSLCQMRFQRAYDGDAGTSWHVQVMKSLPEALLGEFE
ncbi:hypothetical protein LTR56_020948 [Elasticomyces elasticus]|nr:hypothetical protein LTR56_020948 [Elasticomyces elasticus]KAK3665200.1 hypothetical protein LTR22_004007 [Elasticomyces elasticus]KAK4909848.1 hypothetical protein LTR49_021446 [Elasticomyces elasticus]KAK5749739.1 hypothetical protein LTS12_020237 [Elasticomyces elasticus]